MMTMVQLKWNFFALFSNRNRNLWSLSFEWRWGLSWSEMWIALTHNLFDSSLRVFVVGNKRSLLNIEESFWLKPGKNLLGTVRVISKGRRQEGGQTRPSFSLDTDTLYKIPFLTLTRLKSSSPFEFLDLDIWLLDFTFVFFLMFALFIFNYMDRTDF